MSSRTAVESKSNRSWICWHHHVNHRLRTLWYYSNGWNSQTVNISDSDSAIGREPSWSKLIKAWSTVHSTVQCSTCGQMYHSPTARWRRHVYSFVVFLRKIIYCFFLCCLMEIYVAVVTAEDTCLYQHFHAHVASTATAGFLQYTFLRCNLCLLWCQ